MRKFGYARVSTEQQCLETQFEILKENGVRDDRILWDKSTGSNSNRSGLEALKIKLESGDKILITRLDLSLIHI